MYEFLKAQFVIFQVHQKIYNFIWQEKETLYCVRIKHYEDTNEWLDEGEKLIEVFSIKENIGENSVVWFDLACSQHLAGLPGGRVGGQVLTSPKTPV